MIKTFRGLNVLIQKNTNVFVKTDSETMGIELTVCLREVTGGDIM